MSEESLITTLLNLMFLQNWGNWHTDTGIVQGKHVVRLNRVAIMHLHNLGVGWYMWLQIHKPYAAYEKYAFLLSVAVYLWENSVWQTLN